MSLDNRYMHLSTVLSEANVLHASKAISSHQHLTDFLSSLSLSLDRLGMSTGLDNITDRIETLTLGVHSENKNLDESERSNGLRIAGVLEDLDRMMQASNSKSEIARNSMVTTSEEDITQIKRRLTEEFAFGTRKREDRLVNVGAHLHELSQAVEKEKADYKRGSTKLVGEISSNLKRMKNEIESERMVRLETTRRIRDIVQSTSDDLEKEFNVECNLQKRGKDNLKKLIVQIKYKLDDLE